VKRILVTILSICIICSTLVLSSEINEQPKNFITLNITKKQLNDTQFITLPTGATFSHIEIINWKHTTIPSTKPETKFFPTTELTDNTTQILNDLKYSRMIYEEPFDYELLKKGKEQTIRFFVPTVSYSNDYKTETTSLQARIYYTQEPKGFTTSFDPQSPDYEYVIITNETFWPTFNTNFKSWKISTDSKITGVLITNVSDILAWGNYTVNDTYGDATNTTNGNSWISDGDEIHTHYSLFNDTQSQIRNYLRFCYNTYNTRYVLLGGNKNAVPPRMVASYAVGSCGSCTGWDNDTSHASDMYFACLHNNMNSNLNAYWMENDVCGTAYDDIDWGYDLLVGRVLGGSIEKINNWINKTKTYITDNTQNYLQKNIVACKGNTNSISNQSWTGWVTSWGSLGPGVGDEFSTNQSFVNNQNISQAQWQTMNLYVNGSVSTYDGIHLIYHTGHGGTLYSADGGTYRPYQVNNTDTPTFVYTEGCHSGDFGTDVNSRTERWMEFPECSHVLVSNSAYGWFVASTYYGELMMREMFNSTVANYTTSFCEAHFNAREQQGHANDCVWGMIFKETNFFGDPALEWNWYTTGFTPSSDSPIFISIDGEGNQTTINTSTPTFIWNITENTIQYNLQISTDSTFTSLVLNLTDINEFTYPTYYSTDASNITFTIPPASALSSFGLYYCRVRSYMEGR